MRVLDFNCPLQLQKTPWGELADVPSQADVFDFTLRCVSSSYFGLRSFLCRDKDLIFVMTGERSTLLIVLVLMKIRRRIGQRLSFGTGADHTTSRQIRCKCAREVAQYDKDGCDVCSYGRPIGQCDLLLLGGRG